MRTPANYREFVESGYRDSDGYWVKLRPGFQCYGLHYIHAETIAERAKDLRSIVPCDKTCDTCGQNRGNGGAS